ncbi:MalY/PatB family protein [Egicoccus halophilus]|uniref:cysteine-S-conjugate beta-lyase n=1 Tax=Egicoccus halophilus TaxID=1670830 RepID=A0A8J3EUR7_9ACTN|nr:aminotransferase class I/II-fold pyridoxal phosphate-dependent enzyme [Egicoccus halophilus]GGI08236.1 cystathionine beta-lyase [Egicoccus halophilus]
MTDVGDPFEALTLAQLRQRSSIKWRAHPEDVLPLWVAEMDVALAPAVVDVLRHAVAIGDTGYASGEGYVEALAERARPWWNWTIAPQRARLVPDVMRGATELVRLVTPPGGTVLVNPPVYPPFFAFVRHTGRRVVEVPLTEDARLDLDAIDAAMARARADGPTAYLLCSPHNPTGTVHRADELRQLAALARTRGVRVLSDEIHAPLVLSGPPFVPYLTVEGSEDAFALHSASKGWNLPGLKAAVAVGGPATTDDLDRLPVEVSHGASHLGVLAHTAALRDGVGWLDEVRRELLARRELLGELVEEHLPAVRWRPGAATYLAWLDCRALGHDDPAGHLLRRGRVALVAGDDFGVGGAGHVRLNFATSRAVLTEAVRRMGTVA